MPPGRRLMNVQSVIPAQCYLLTQEFIVLSVLTTNQMVLLQTTDKKESLSWKGYEFFPAGHHGSSCFACRHVFPIKVLMDLSKATSQFFRTDFEFRLLGLSPYILLEEKREIFCSPLKKETAFSMCAHFYFYRKNYVNKINCGSYLH